VRVELVLEERVELDVRVLELELEERLELELLDERDEEVLELLVVVPE
jgi:hypothetical protein